MGVYWGTQQASPIAFLPTLKTDAANAPSLVNPPTQTWWSGGTYPTGSYNYFSAIQSSCDTILANGAIPVLDWYSTLFNSDPAFSLKSIYQAGTHDGYLATWATQVAAWGHAIMIDFDPEFNGNWMGSYDEAQAIGSPVNARGDFKLMWRHVHDIFVANGATNVTWIWSPNYQAPDGSGAATAETTATMASYYPGDTYVDWLGIHAFAYNGSPTRGATPWWTFTEMLTGTGNAAGWLANSWSRLIAINASKPIMLSSFGVDSREGTDTNAAANTNPIENGTKKGAWFTDLLLTQVPGKGATNFGRVRAVRYYNVDVNSVNSPYANGYSLNDEDCAFESPSATATGGTFGGKVYTVVGAGAGQTAFQNAIGSPFYINGGALLLPDGLKPTLAYEAMPQISRLKNAVLSMYPTKLIGFWLLNDPSGITAVDLAGTPHNGTYTGGFTLGQPPITTGALDLSVLLDGTGYVTIPDNDAFSMVTTRKLSGIVGFVPTALPAGGTFGSLIAKGAGGNFEYRLGITSAGGVQLDHWDLAGSPYAAALIGSGVSVGAFCLAGFILDMDRTPHGRVYLNAATPANSADAAVTPANGTAPLTFGRRNDGTHYFSGREGFVALWSNTFTDFDFTELWAMFNTRRRSLGTYVG